MAKLRKTSRKDHLGLAVVEDALFVRLSDESLSSPQGPEWRFSSAQVVQVGRHADNDIVIVHDAVSRFHLTLFHDGMRWQCASFGLNGTFLANQPVSHVELSEGMILRLGPRGPMLQFDCVSMSPRELRGTMTMLIDDMKQGDQQSFEQLWSRCFATIVKLARQRLGSSRKRVEDEEDVASVVMQKLYASSVDGQLPELTDRQSLWRLLLTMTRNAALDSIHRENRAKRGGGKVRGHSIANDWGSDAADSPNGFDQIVGNAPTPASVVSVNEQVNRWLERLPDDECRQIALLKLEGFSTEEIADQLNLSLRTAERRIKQIREAWSR